MGGFRFATQPLKSRFDEKAFVTVAAKKQDGSVASLEALEELGIELDCEEVSRLDEQEAGFELVVASDRANATEEALTAQGYAVENSEVRLVPHHAVSLSAEEFRAVEKFYELVGEDEQFTQVHDNLEEEVQVQSQAAA